uniref:uncharacterized protein LOC129120574 n=1 Tax=Agelaius phoeniceus TaxID=39638 RepID=UPI0023ECE426|nr:uncharacterized protein LOC129120574 [Agelaius phoeniceus]
MFKAVLAGAAWSLPCPSPETQREPCAQGPLAPCQEGGSSPGSRLEQPAGKGEEDPCGMRLQRASRGAASGWRKAKGPTRWHQGTCEEQNGHLEATWRKGMHSFVFSTPPVAPTWESFPSLLHFQLDPWKTLNSIPLIFRSSWPPPALRSQPAGTQPGNTKEHGWQPAGDTEAPGPEKQPWPQQPAWFGAGNTHLQATPPGTLQKSFGHGAR